MLKGYKVPRWLYRPILLEASKQFALDPNQLANDTAYKWKLYGLSFVGAATVQEAAPWTTTAGGVKNRVMVEIGKSGCSDMNLVSGPIGAVCGVRRRVRQTFGVHNDAVSFNFFSPVRIPRDCGLHVKVQNGNALAAVVMPEITFVAKGVTDSGVPYIFGGQSIDGLTGGADSEIKSADLMNRGKEAVWLHTMCFKTFQVDSAGVEYDGSLRFVRALVNPTKGIQWMPVGTPIPVGNISPVSQTWNNATDLGPCCYWFPEPTYLWPEQHLSVKFTNLTNKRQEIHVCLFGELEVK